MHDASPLPQQRDLFDLPPGVTYLNCAAKSPQLRSVTAAGLAAVRTKAQPWTRASADFFAGAERLRAAAGRLMGADAEGVAIVPAASYGIAVAARNVAVGRGQNVVVLHEQFPSNVYAWRERAAAEGAEVRTVTKAPGDDWTDAVLAAVDADTAVVSVPNCHWTDGTLVDLVAVGERARAVGAALVVDASQSLGVLPIDVATVRPDFLVAVGYKWLLGPYGLGYLYAAPRWRETGRPLEASWMSRAGAEDFTALVDYRDGYRPGARRFDVGEFTQFVLGPMALAGLAQLLDWGVARIQARLRQLTSLTVAGVEEYGWTSVAGERRAGHVVGLRRRGGLPAGLAEVLAKANVHVSVRGDALRVSPYVYNDGGDVGRLRDILARHS